MRITALITALAVAFPATAAAAVPVRSGALLAQAGSSAQKVTLEARQLQGAEAIAVTGTAAPGATVTVTLTALVSADLPTILVSRHDVAADVNGRFGAVIPIASAYERGITLNVIATSGSGAAPAQVQLTTGAPNAGATVPFDSGH
ncbi:MAG TPA: hypothetical protein VFL13_12285 [Candidatus Baltobacteraceae bacterium]|nr:hypothetical protein [Candidatus Baltobacteraceae bacterium]